MNQKLRILQELKKKEWFSLADALSMNPGIYRLSERIRDLESMGYEIIHAKVEGKPYSKYKLVERPKITLPPARVGVQQPQLL